MLRLFLSVDIAGSTAYKAKFAGAKDVGWLRVFESFFQIFPIVLIGQVAVEFFDEETLPTLRVWKVLGDEMIFTSEPASARDMVLLLRALFNAMARYEAQHFGELRMQLKAAAWLARFPEPNIEIEIPEMSHGVTYIDYLGPDIDLGFRICSFAQPSAIAVSVDLLEQLLSAEAVFDFYRGGDALLPGVNHDRPYPILWIRPAGRPFQLGDAAELYPKLTAALAAGPTGADALRGLIASVRGGTEGNAND